MHIRCPHCHFKLDVAESAELSALNCTSCGGQFNFFGPLDTTKANVCEKTIGQFHAD
jgi:hypothetical protein